MELNSVRAQRCAWQSVGLPGEDAGPASGSGASSDIFESIDRIAGSLAGLKGQIEGARINDPDRELMRATLKNLLMSIEGFYHYVLQIQIDKDEKRQSVIDGMRVERKILLKRIAQLEGEWAGLEELEGV